MADQLRGNALFSYAVEHYLDTVYRAAFHAAPSPQDAEDVAQEVFEALLRSGKRFREPEHLRAWLLRVTVNKCKNLYRAKRRTEVPLTEAIPAPRRRSPPSWTRCAPCPRPTAVPSTSTTLRAIPPRRSGGYWAPSGTRCSPGWPGGGRPCGSG